MGVCEAALPPPQSVQPPPQSVQPSPTELHFARRVLYNTGYTKEDSGEMKIRADMSEIHLAVDYIRDTLRKKRIPSRESIQAGGAHCAFGAAGSHEP